MLRKQVVSSLAWLATARLSGQLITWTSTIVVMRLLAPADYGLVAMAMVPIGLIQLMEALGMGSALVQKEELERQMIEKVFVLLLLFNLALFLLNYLAAPAIATFFEEPQLRPMSRVLGLTFPLNSLSTVPDSLLRRDMRFRRKSIVVLISMVAHAAVTLGLAFSGFGVWALVAWSTRGVILSCGGLQPCARTRL